MPVLSSECRPLVRKRRPAPGDIAPHIPMAASGLRGCGSHRELDGVPALQLNCPDVTAARPHAWDIHPALAELIRAGTRGIVSGINRLSGSNGAKMYAKPSSLLDT
jgi:hypothetical protein